MRTKIFRFVFVGLLLLGCLVALSACTTSQETATSPVEESVVTAEPTTVVEEDDEQPMPIAAVPADNECLTCHTDKQMLIDTAKPEEVVESENSGEG